MHTLKAAVLSVLSEVLDDRLKSKDMIWRARSQLSAASRSDSVECPLREDSGEDLDRDREKCNSSVVVSLEMDTLPHPERKVNTVTLVLGMFLHHPRLVDDSQQLSNIQAPHSLRNSAAMLFISGSLLF